MTGADIGAAAAGSDPVNLHASTVAMNGMGLLILGPSGSGKSALALQLLALGARLVADDRTILARRGAQVIAQCPPALSGLIEARHIGILHAVPLPEVTVRLVVDLGREETDRLPQRHQMTLLGTTFDLVFASRSSHFPAALLCYLSGGRER